MRPLHSLLTILAGSSMVSSLSLLLDVDEGCFRTFLSSFFTFPSSFFFDDSLLPRDEALLLEELGPTRTFRKLDIPSLGLDDGDCLSDEWRLSAELLCLLLECSPRWRWWWWWWWSEDADDVCSFLVLLSRSLSPEELRCLLLEEELEHCLRRSWVEVDWRFSLVHRESLDLSWSLMASPTASTEVVLLMPERFLGGSSGVQLTGGCDGVAGDLDRFSPTITFSCKYFRWRCW